MRVRVSAPRYLVQWDYSRDRCMRRDVVTTSHRLAELSHFSDELIADLIDRYPPKATTVATMGDNPAHPSEWQVGRLGDQGGSELLDIVRRGRLQLMLWNLPRHQPPIGRVIGRLCRELMECQPGLRTRAHNGHLQISSPRAPDYYQFDTDPRIFWQVRGSTRFWVYPPREPFLSASTIAQTLCRERIDAIHYDPAFDDHARMIELQPGQALAIPQYTPIRSHNLDGLNISLHTHYQTRETLRRNRMHRAGRMLSRFLPLEFDASQTSGLKAAMKNMLVSLADLCGHREAAAEDAVKPRYKIEKAFCVDSSAAGGIGPLHPSSPQPVTAAVIVPLTDVACTTDVPVLET